MGEEEDKECFKKFPSKRITGRKQRKSTQWVSNPPNRFQALVEEQGEENNGEDPLDSVEGNET